MGGFREIILLVVLAGCTLFISNAFLNGSLKSSLYLSRELKSPPDSLYQWNIGTEAPFKYRVLQRSIVLNTYKLITRNKDSNTSFFFIYRAYAILFHVLSILLFRYFLIKNGMAEIALAGSILYALLPPLLMAYNVPLHTREDTLAYSILTMGLLAIIKNNTFSTLTTILLGVLCRETLLLLAFVNLFFNKKQNLWARLTIALAGFGLFFLIRINSAFDKYNYLEGFNWNIQNPEQVIGFGFIAFGLLWVPFLLSFRTKNQNPVAFSIITLSGPSVFFLVILTTLMGGIFNEIRLLYLLAPWVIVAALSYYLENKEEITSIFQLKRYRLFVMITLLLVIIFTAFVMINTHQLVGTSKYDVPYKPWILIAIIQAYLLMISVPIFFRSLKKMKIVSIKLLFNRKG